MCARYDSEQVCALTSQLACVKFRQTWLLVRASQCLSVAGEERVEISNCMSTKAAGMFQVCVGGFCLSTSFCLFVLH